MDTGTDTLCILLASVVEKESSQPSVDQDMRQAVLLPQHNGLERGFNAGFQGGQVGVGPLYWFPPLDREA